jgi:hypothetical protein
MPLDSRVVAPKSSAAVARLRITSQSGQKRLDFRLVRAGINPTNINLERV